MLDIFFAEASDPGSIFDLIQSGGIVGLLVIIIYGGFKKDPWWVFGWVFRDLAQRHEALRDEKNAWRDSALKAGDIAITLTEKTTKES